MNKKADNNKYPDCDDVLLSGNNNKAMGYKIYSLYVCVDT
jgi:hypothetical protein